MSDRTVFVGNLSWDTRWQGLKDHMRQAGSVLHAEVFTESSGRSAGCGIVEFETREEAIHSIQTMNDSVLDGRQVFVREDRDQGRRAGGGGGGGGGGGFGDRGGGFNDRGGGFNDRGGGFNDRGGGFSDRGGGFNDRGGGFGDRGGGFNDRGGGFGGGGFNDRGGGFNDRGGGFGGGGFGDGFGGNNGGFQDRGGFDQGGGFQDRGFDRDKGFGGDFGGRGDFGGDSGGRGGFRSDRGRKVVVSNLPYHTRWQELKDIFRSCGDVIRADVMMGSDGRSKGMGTILFEKEDDANTAVSRLNGAELDGRVIEVRLDKF